VLQALRFGAPPRAIALHAAAATPALHADAAPGTAASRHPLRAGTDGDTIFPNISKKYCNILQIIDKI
jgi:hypothetical protein